MIKNFIKKITPSFLLKLYHYKLALLGAVLYGFPSRKLVVFGVTGTNGKSTVVDFITRIFEENGFKTASLSSVRFKIGDKERENKLKMTMPGRFKIQKFLKQAVKAGCTHVVLEVTSEGIRQYRHKFINFTGAVFTNLSPEHIESHGGFGKYRQTKEKLFKATKKIHIINLDDENAEHFLKYPAKEKWGYTMDKEQKIENRKEMSVVRCLLFSANEKGISFVIEDIQLNVDLLGSFNVYNALAAICAGLSQGVSLETCKKALEKIKGIPGRMEVVMKEPFTVIVDYAHTPAALEQVYKNVSSFKLQASSPMICVLGSCGGGRDKWKRPILGELAAKYCQEIIITNEDPYDEDPMEIIEQVASGAENIRENQRNNQRKSTVLKILNRKEAIRKALKLANPGDVVIITGKGCEPWMCVANGKKIPWNDRQIVREEFSATT